MDPLNLYSVDYFVGGTVAGGYVDYGVDEPLHRRNAVDRLRRVADAGLEPPGRLVEIGAGYAFFLDEARRLGWEIAGTDISSYARARAAQLHIDLAAELVEVPGPADVLAAFQVLEHIVDPFAALASGVELVRRGGLVIVETWDRGHWMARALGRRWQQVSPPAVIHLFTAAGVEHLAARVGLVDVVIRATPKYVSLGAVAGQVATDRPRLKPPLERLRSSKLGRRSIKYGFGDLVTLTAHKA